jgi:hypothetical protein
LKAWITLCDSAEVQSGKLYMLGGGIYMLGPGPIRMGVAVLGSAPWEFRGRRIDARIALLDGNNQPAPVPMPMGSAPLEVQVALEIAPSLGTPPGSSLPFTFAFNVGGIPLPAGDYSWCLYLGGEDRVAARARFTVRPETPHGVRPA